jgi:hypothetical protein
VVCGEQPTSAQVDGQISVLFDVLPDLSEAPGRQEVAEMRTRVFVERRQSAGDRWRFVLGGYLDGLVANREATGATETAADAIVRPADLYAEYASERFDVRAGFSRIVWGRLDEFQPTDVVNALDFTRFLLEGRSEARLPVGLVRGRVFLPHASTLEALLVPVFRQGRFDQLDEETSPFNVLAGFPALVPRPEAAWHNVQGGARFTSTAGRVDWSVSSYRGIDAFQPFSRFTMVGGDVETVRGQWGVRGEAAWFVDDEVQAGVGADRRAGDYRVAGNMLVTRQADDTDVLLVASADRSFARETRTVRVFGVYEPTDGTTFARVIAATSLRDNLWLEGSGGLFAGTSLDTIGRLTRRDFVYARLKVFF